MLKTKIIEKYYPPKKILELFSGIQFGISYNANKIEKELMNLLNDLSSLSILNNYCLNYPKIDNKKEIDSIKGTITKLKND